MPSVMRVRCSVHAVVLVRRAVPRAVIRVLCIGGGACAVRGARGAESLIGAVHIRVLCIRAVHSCCAFVFCAFMLCIRAVHSCCAFVLRPAVLLWLIRAQFKVI